MRPAVHEMDLSQDILNHRRFCFAEFPGDVIDERCMMGWILQANLWVAVAAKRFNYFSWDTKTTDEQIA